MAAPKATIWKLEPHTRAKHAILRRYLQAWTPILAQGGFPRIAYIDGFAGPGLYDGGEDGSPIIALKTVAEHGPRIKGKVILVFVEKDRERAQVLREIVDEMIVPPNCAVIVEQGRSFEDAFTDFHRLYTDRAGRLIPTFAFIDPFGWTGAPFSVVQSILNQPSCEVLVTFMYEEINQFLSQQNQSGNFDAFFGSRDWRACLEEAKPIARNRCLHDLYLRQLRDAARAKYVRSFQMRNERDVTDYYLFYATNSRLGLQKMKEAMWKVDQSGEFTFSDTTDPNQPVLFRNEPRYDELRQLILTRFAGGEATVGEVEDFVVADTAFRETHYKQNVLRPLELSDPPRLTILNPPTKRRRGKYGSPSLRLRFP